ncbi:hypothetical protein GCM10020001_101740 [Nonomuraea salmonea]
MTTGHLPVPGATLHYEVRGAGPALLISQSGEGDARRSTDLADHLLDSYTVITYDRRGLSRSALDRPPPRPLEAARRRRPPPAGRAHRPAGGDPRLQHGRRHRPPPGPRPPRPDRHPHRPRTGVPPGLLPPAERTRHLAELAGIQRLYRREGLTPALKAITEALGIDPAAPPTPNPAGPRTP